MAAGAVKIKFIDTFYGGIARDDKSSITGAGANFEELDIFANKDFIQAEQIFSAEVSFPASTEIYAYDAGDDDTLYGYGRKTTATAGTVRLVSTGTDSGTSTPSNFTTLFNSADTTNLATRIGDTKFFRTTEAQATYLYYIKGTGTSWYLVRYNITAASEGGASSGAATPTSADQLTGLTGSFDRPTMKVIYGELFICHNQFIAKVDKAGAFTAKAFTLPLEWQVIDLIPVSDVCLLLARNKNRTLNISRCFWWDLTATTQFDDSFTIPMGGPQWITNQKESIRILCASNGNLRVFQLSGAFPGAFPVEIPGLTLTSIGTETTTRPISMAKMIANKDKILYFGLLKTDKSGVYALGQLDGDKPNALILSKRFSTGDYSLQRPTAFFIQGPNYYAALDDNGTETVVRCATLNSPTRSSNAVYETINIDGGEPYRLKQFQSIFVVTKPLFSASTTITVSARTDFASSYVTINRADGTVFNTSGGTIAEFPLQGAAVNNLAKVIQVKVAFASSTTNSVSLQAVLVKYVDGNIVGND